MNHSSWKPLETSRRCGHPGVRFGEAMKKQQNTTQYPNITLNAMKCQKIIHIYTMRLAPQETSHRTTLIPLLWRYGPESYSKWVHSKLFWAHSAYSAHLGTKQFFVPLTALAEEVNPLEWYEKLRSHMPNIYGQGILELLKLIWAISTEKYRDLK